MMSVTTQKKADVQQRGIVKIFDAQRLLEGGGFPVQRPFPSRDLPFVDPFLLFDHMGPVDWGPGKALGAPDHPHRGFETVTYMLEGHMQHKDSQGHVGDLGPGDVQWMTAGAGVVHSELPEATFKQHGGVMNGIQLWINLPAKHKMIKPRYQEIPAAQIPEETSDDGRVKVRVIAGEAMGQSAVIDTHTPIIYLHYIIEPGGEIEQAIPPDYNGLVYVLTGEVQVTEEKKSVKKSQMALLSEGTTLNLAVDSSAISAASFLILAGLPLKEPVARHGPFVMNTNEEIRQAFRDYENGLMGKIEV